MADWLLGNIFIQLTLKHTSIYVIKHCPSPQVLLHAWLIGYLAPFSWKLCSIPHKFLTWPLLDFTCLLTWNHHRRDGVFVLLQITLRMRRKSWKGFHNKAPRNVSKTFTFGSNYEGGSNEKLKIAIRIIYKYLNSSFESPSYQRWLFLRQCSLNCCTVLYFSEMKWFQEHFEATIHILPSLMLYIRGILQYLLLHSDPLI